MLLIIITILKINNTSDITNNITRHNHNNYDIKKVHKHIKHTNNYDIEINPYNKKSLNKKQYYNFYHDNFSEKLRTYR